MKKQDFKTSSDRSFGIVFTVVFAIIGLWPVIFSSGPARWWALAIAASFLFVALVKPCLLSGLNKAWLKFGMLLHTITSPIIMGVIFFLLFVPIGVVTRLFGVDFLKMKMDAKAKTYWVTRDKTMEASMDNQF